MLFAYIYRTFWVSSYYYSIFILFFCGRDNGRQISNFKHYCIIWVGGKEQSVRIQLNEWQGYTVPSKIVA